MKPQPQPSKTPLCSTNGITPRRIILTAIETELWKRSLSKN
nr:MAG TPA: hypothetical protein [Caudoviricetes sp.]